MRAAPALLLIVGCSSVDVSRLELNPPEDAHALVLSLDRGSIVEFVAVDLGDVRAGALPIVELDDGVPLPDLSYTARFYPETLDALGIRAGPLLAATDELLYGAIPNSPMPDRVRRISDSRDTGWETAEAPRSFLEFRSGELPVQPDDCFTFENERSIDRASPRGIDAALRLNDGRVLFAAERRLTFLTLDGLAAAPSSELNRSPIRALVLDEDGDVWGASCERQGPNDCEATGTCQDVAFLYQGHPDTGFTLRYESTPEAGGNCPYAIAVWKDAAVGHRVFVLTEGGALHEYSGAERIEHLTPVPNSARTHGSMLDLGGTLLVVQDELRGEVQRFDGSSTRPEPVELLAGEKVRTLLETPTGVIMVTHDAQAETGSRVIQRFSQTWAPLGRVPGDTIATGAAFHGSYVLAGQNGSLVHRTSQRFCTPESPVPQIDINFLMPAGPSRFFLMSTSPIGVVVARPARP